MKKSPEQRIVESVRATKSEKTEGDQRAFWRAHPSSLDILFTIRGTVRDLTLPLRSGNDLDIVGLDNLIAVLQDVRSKAQRFESSSDVVGTEYDY